MLKKTDAKKPFSLSISGLIIAIAFVYLMNSILLHDDFTIFSIRAVQMTLNHWLKHWHILVVCFLPVYVAFFSFGAGICGYFFGSWLHYFFLRFCKK